MSFAKDTHPTRKELSDFGSGRLNAVESDAIEQHLAECADCCETLKDLPNDDTFVALLRPEVDTSVAGDVQPAIPETIVPETSQETRPPESEKTQFADAGRAELQLLPELRDHPRYRIVELLGHGGMGDVYRAEHKVMNRQVALKVIKPQLVQNDAAVRRFRREVQAAASLHHPNIVTAHDAEQAGDLHYLVMEFVDGEDLDEVIRQRGPLPVDEACQYIRQAAEGLQHAHERGMVHRDIKPHNLMIEVGQASSLSSSSSDKLEAYPTLKILDFGLANFASEVAEDELKHPEAGYDTGAQSVESNVPGASILHQLTQMGTMMGTPDYIAPEQAKDAHTADIRSDIYSLGCTFYTLLTAKAPFGEGSVLDKVRAHTERDAPPLSDFRDDVPADVEAVLQKMMAKDPAERYQTPAEVAEALSAVERLSRVVQKAEDDSGESSYRKRRPLVLTAVATLFLALIAAAAAVVFYIQTNNGVVRVEVTDPSLKVTLNGQTISVNDNGRPLTIRAGEQKLIVRQEDSDFELVTDSFQLRRGDNIALKVDLLPGEVVVSKDGQPFGAKQVATDSPSTDSTANEIRVVFDERKGNPVLHVDGKEFQQAEEGMLRIRELVAKNPGSVVLLDAGLNLDRNDPRNLMMMDRVEKMIAATGATVVPAPGLRIGREAVIKRDQRTNQLRQIGLALHTFHDTYNSFPPGNPKQHPEWFDENGRPHLSWRVHLLPMFGQEDFYKRFRLNEPWDSSHNKALLAEMPEQFKSADDPANATLSHRLTNPYSTPPFKTSDDPTTTTLLAVVGEGTAYEGKTGLTLKDIKDGWANTAYVVDSGRERAVPWTKPEDLPFDTQEPIRAFGTSDFGDEFLALMADGSVQSIPYDTAPESLRALFTRAAGDKFDETAKRTTPLPTSKQDEIALARKFPGHRERLADIAVSSDGQFVISGGLGMPLDRPVRVWDVGTGREVLNGFEFSQHGVGNVVISPSGKYLATRPGVIEGVPVRTVKLWDFATGKHLQDLAGHTDYVQAIVFSPDEKHVFTAGKDETVRMWNRQTGEQLQIAKTGVRIPALALSADGKHLYFSGISRDQTATNLVEWSVETWKEVRRFQHLTPAAYSLSMSPDGRTICGGAYNRGTITLWDLEAGRVRAEQQAHDDSVTSTAYTVDGRHIITTACDKTIKIWDARTLRLVASHTAETHCTNHMQPMPDGRSIVTAGGYSFKDGKAVSDGDYALRLWRLPESVWPEEQKNELKPLGQLEGHGRTVNDLAWHPDGKRAVSIGSRDAEVRMWDVAGGKTLWTAKVEAEQEPEKQFAVSSVAVSPDGKLVAVGSETGLIYLLDAETGKEQRKWPSGVKQSLTDLRAAPRGWGIAAMHFSPGGDWLAAVGAVGSPASVWDVKTGKQIQLSDRLTDAHDVLFTADGKCLLTGGLSLSERRITTDDQGVKAFDRIAGTRADPEAMVLSVASSHDGKLAASATSDGSIYLRHRNANGSFFPSNENNLRADHPGVSNLAFTADGRYLISAGTPVPDAQDQSASSLRVWDIATMKPLFAKQSQAPVFHRLALSPDGRALLTTGSDPLIHIWHLPRSVWPEVNADDIPLDRKRKRRGKERGRGKGDSHQI